MRENFMLKKFFDSHHFVLKVDFLHKSSGHLDFLNICWDIKIKKTVKIPLQARRWVETTLLSLFSIVKFILNFNPKYNKAQKTFT